MKEFIKKNITIIMAFSLPIIFILGIASFTYIPSFLIKTNYNFIYITCTDSNGYNSYCHKNIQNSYQIVKGKLVFDMKNPTLDSDKDGILDINENYSLHIFLHNTEKNESREITLSEVQSFSLSELLTSPDGVSVSGEYDSGPDILFLFDSNSSYEYYLKKGRHSRKLNLVNSGQRYYYRNNFKFMAWVISKDN